MRPVGSRFPRQGIMHLEKESRPDRKFFRYARGNSTRYFQERGGQSSGLFPFDSILPGSENKGVMNHLGCGRPHFGGLYPSVFGEICLHPQVGVGHLPGCLDLDFPREGKDCVRRADRPFAFADSGEGSVRRVSFRFPVFDPCKEVGFVR